ncbi:DMT family transporter [Brevibacillus laterosporus]|uniref:EamA family transporter n=1 Tax=Brevibacillus TaxID=55080 RepID=UPI00036D8BAB|nr:MULTISPECIES: DMT family transporter [Brevibacillus]ATO48302.1 multidrug transporter [Brevibacillus laterosporus DSM 25]MCG7318330.1 DMT family transporter [Brevibacillus laterosporus]MED2005886.1 DMT family transporter [Brevibacillus laterosporus]RFB31849.1 EamA family transporter [Brevibacillus sp. VP]
MFRYSFLVLAGACSIGVLAIFVKFAYQMGFTLGEVIGSQYLTGWLLLLVLTLLFFRQRVPLKKAIVLFFAGTSASFTGICYYAALQTIPASIGIVLLFQFVWIGIIIESISTKTLPSKEKIISVLFLLVGTALSGGLLNQSVQSFEISGILLGLLSAVSFACYLFVSGKVAVDVPPFPRSVLLIAGALVLILIVFPPTFLYDGTLEKGLWKYALALGTFSIVIPSIAFSIGIPKIGSGLATILATAELPVTVILSVLILKEAVSVSQWIGVSFIFIGIAIPQLAHFVTRADKGEIPR